jgi:hypothetical protein
MGCLKISDLKINLANRKVEDENVIVAQSNEV